MLEKRDEIKRILFGDKDIDDAYSKQPWSKQNIYIRNPRRLKFEFEKSLFNLNVTYSEKHIGKYSNFSNKI